VGRERADLQNFVHNAIVGWNPLTSLQLNFETSFEDANNREQANTIARCASASPRTGRRRRARA